MKRINTICKVVLIILGLAFLNTAIQAIVNPQATMDFVEVVLGNVSAKSSIRSFYGGVNLAFAIFMIYGAFKDQKTALTISALYCSGFAFGRFYSLAAEGMPSSFVITWMVLETFLAALSWYLLSQKKKPEMVKH